MNGVVVIALLAGVPILMAVLIVYVAERDLRKREERFRESFKVWDR